MEGEAATDEGSRPKKRRKKRELQTLTTSFAYVEAGEKKSADVTLVLCNKCADKLALAKGGASGSDNSRRRRSASPAPRHRETDEAPISRDEAGVYIADGFGSYRPVGDDDERPPPKPDKPHPSSYTSLAKRWKR